MGDDLEQRGGCFAGQWEVVPRAGLDAYLGQSGGVGVVRDADVADDPVPVEPEQVVGLYVAVGDVVGADDLGKGAGLDVLEGRRSCRPLASYSRLQPLIRNSSAAVRIS